MLRNANSRGLQLIRISKCCKRCVSSNTTTFSDNTTSSENTTSSNNTTFTNNNGKAQPQPTPLRARATPLTDEIIRVDHAGELGADRIYAGQMAILGNGPMGKTIEHMWEQEKEHRKQFEHLIQQHRVRPTVMAPIWNVAAFALGAGTALMGEKAAMACTVAVETVIVEHYNDQLRQIMDSPNPDKVCKYIYA